MHYPRSLVCCCLMTNVTGLLILLAKFKNYDALIHIMFKLIPGELIVVIRYIGILQEITYNIWLDNGAQI